VSRLLNALGAIGVASPKALLSVLAGLAAVLTSGGLAAAHHVAAAMTVRKMVGAGAALSSAADICPSLVATAVDPLSDWAYGASQRGSPIDDDAVLEIARAMAAAYSCLDAEAQERHLGPLFDRHAETARKPASASDANSRLLPLFSAAVCACRPQTRLPVDDPGQFLGELAAAALATDRPIHRDACLEIIAAAINKAPSAAQRSQLAAPVLQCAAAATGPAATTLRQWVARALVSCNDKVGYECVRWLLAQITDDSAHAVAAADGFSTILCSHDWAVAPATHGVFKVLAKQRFYAVVVPEITSSFRSAQSDTVRANLLVALTHTVRHMPKSVLMNGIESVVPLLLSAIRLTAGSLKAASIRTISMVALETPDTLKDDVTASVIPLLLAALAQASAANTVEVRCAALDALALLPERYAFTVLHTARKDVLAALARARDDRKRVVRVDAVRAYNKWLAFGDIQAA
ncbi:hypothetical protein H4R19_005021, partial [Coemansia spiralis]